MASATRPTTVGRADSAESSRRSVPRHRRPDFGGLNQHSIFDFSDSVVESAAKDARKSQHVVNLVGVIRTPGGHDEGAGGLGQVRHDFWNRIGQTKDDRLRIHKTDHFRLQSFFDAHADKISAPFKASDSPPITPRGLVTAESLTLLDSDLPVARNYADAVADRDILKSVLQKHLGHRRAGRSGTVNHHPGRRGL